MSIEAHHVIRRKNDSNSQYRTLRGVQVIQLVAANETCENKNVNLFGDSNNRKNFSSGEVIIKNNTSGYEDDDSSLTLLKNYINGVGYIEIVMFRLQSPNPSQVTEILNICEEDEKGQKCMFAIYTQNSFSPYQHQSTIVDVQHKVTMNKPTYISFKLWANSTYSITMFCGKNKGDVQAKVKSFMDEIQDEVDEITRFAPVVRDKKRILQIIK